MDQKAFDSFRKDALEDRASLRDALVRLNDLAIKSMEQNATLSREVLSLTKDTTSLTKDVDSLVQLVSGQSKDLHHVQLQIAGLEAAVEEPDRHEKQDSVAGMPIMTVLKWAVILGLFAGSAMTGIIIGFKVVSPVIHQAHP